MFVKSYFVKKPTGLEHEADEPKCENEGPEAINQDYKLIDDFGHRDDHDIEMIRR